MKKVLYVATVDVHIKTFHLPYLKMLHDNGYEVHVATNGSEQFPNCDVKHQICIERSPFKLNNLKAIKQLKKIIDQEKFDIIHCHTPMGSVVTRLAAKKARKKYGTRVIYTAHGFHFFKGAPLLNWLLFYPIEKYLAKYTDTLITINKEDYNLAKNKFNKRCHDIEYIPGVGIDTKKFDIKMTDEEKEKLKKSIGLDKDDFVLTCVARLDKNKNQGFLINAMEQLVKEHDNIHLLLVGPDELNGYYQKIVDTKKLNKNIHFLGRREDIPNILAITDIVVSASKREGLPVNVMEAFAAGKPVVALNCRGMKDLIEDGENGFIINSNDKNDFSKKVLKLFNDSSLAKKVIKNNESKLKNYDIASIKEDSNQIYESLLQKKVLFLVGSNKFSGAENVVCTMINNIDKRFDCLYCCPKGPIEEQLKNRNIKYFLLDKLSYQNVRKAIKNYHPDIIHAHDYRATFYATMFHKKCRIISHIHVNNPLMTKKTIYLQIFNNVFKKVNNIIWVSESALDNYYYKEKVLNKSTVIYNVVDTNYIKDQAQKDKCDEKYDIAFIGRLSEQKNPERLIEIVKLLQKHKANISVAVVGDGDKRDIIKKLINDCNLTNNIKLYGFQSNPFPILNNSKILVMTSRWEGTPMAALEAQALSKPIVSTPVDGLKKIIKNNYNGYLSDNNDELVNNILLTLNDKNYKQIVENVKKYYLIINNEKEHCSKIEDIYLNSESGKE